MQLFRLVPLFIAVAPAFLAAQHLERLGSPIATFPEPFSSVTGLRELSDGRLLIADRLEQAVRFVDVASGTVEDIGRVGQGPGEYLMPARLLPLPDDRSLLIDFGNMRLSAVDPNGRITAVGSAMGGDQLLLPTASDGWGLIYAVSGGPRASSGPNTPIVRLDLAAKHIDTVASLPVADAGSAQRAVGMSGGRVSVQGGFRPFGARDDWNVAPDGRVVLVHAEPYSIEWIAADGRSTKGPVIAYDRVRITEDDKQAWADRMSSGAVAIAVDGGRGRSGSAMRLPRPDRDKEVWPEFKPPFGTSATSVAPDGSVWVRRDVAFGAPERYDVFDARGNRTRQIDLPTGRRLVGLGAQTLYLVNVDELELQWLEVYRR